jgi:hypothetical protein
MGSRKTAKRYDWPGPDQKTMAAEAKMTAQP